MTLYVKTCDNCNRITDTEHIELVIDTVFGSAGYDGDVCVSCKSIMEYCKYQYLQLYEQLTKTLDKKRLALDSNLKRDLK